MLSLEKNNRAWLEWGIVIVGVVVFAFRVRLSWNDSVDDAYIYLRYARNLAEHGQLAFNVGQPVEGFSSPLWVLLLGGLWKVGAVGMAPAKGLSVACAIATFIVTFWTLRALEVKWASLFVVATLALDCDLARWAVSGMDTPLFALGLALVFFAAAARRWSTLAITVGLLPWLRPEGLFVGGLLGVLLLPRQETSRLAWRAVAPVLLLVAVRFAVFRDLLPNTFYAKMTTGGGRVYSGATYVWTFIERRPALTLLALVATIAQIKKLSITTLAATISTVSLFGFSWSAHGDWMANHRFLVPALASLLVASANLRLGTPIVILLLGVETTWSTSRRLDQSWRGAEAVKDTFVTMTPDPIVKPEPLDWMPSHIVRNLSYYVLPNETVAHVDMGQLPFVMHDVNFLDGFGLVDREVARLTYAPSQERKAEVAEAFFKANPPAAVVVADPKAEVPVTLGQAAFVSDPRFKERYREQSRVGTWGGNLCIIYVRRDRTALEKQAAERNEQHWFLAVPQVRSSL